MCTPRSADFDHVQGIRSLVEVAIVAAYDVEAAKFCLAMLSSQTLVGRWGFDCVPSKNNCHGFPIRL